MLDQSMKKALVGDVDKYVPDCAESLKRNGHMNEYKGEAIDEKAVDGWLRAYVEAFDKRGRAIMGGGEFADVCVAEAKLFVRKHELPVSTATRDAIIVDFLNLIVGKHCCLDLGLYTRDFAKA
ncbi:MAG: hypothetical protein ACHREM_06615 [Polyangiales bacterium]